jgi:hypothetical protein
MLIKIFPGLLGLSLALASPPVLARSILVGVTNDGAKLYALTNYPPNSEDDEAYTSFCNSGEVLSQPVKGTKDFE